MMTTNKGLGDSDPRHSKQVGRLANASPRPKFPTLPISHSPTLPLSLSPSLQKAIFIDRDGTAFVDTVYSVDPALLKPLPGTVEGMRRLQEAGYLLVIITNQSGIARGKSTEEGLRRFHDHMESWLAERGIRLAGIYYCPHHANGTVPEYTRECDCRKPAAGMILRAARDLGIDLKRSWMIGDRSFDIAAGRAAGCRTVRIGWTDAEDSLPDHNALNLAQAAEFILRES